MKYIGNKTRLLDFIQAAIDDQGIPHQGIFADPFTGTTSVAQHFKKLGFNIISSDIMSYSYVLQKAYIELNEYPLFSNLREILRIPARTQSSQVLGIVIDHLNSLPPCAGFMTKNYSPAGLSKRQYFKTENAEKIDTIRNWLATNRINRSITDGEYYLLLASLIDEADYVANMSGTYGAFLKIWRSMALKDLNLKAPKVIESNLTHKVYQEDANKLIRKIKADVLYLDPPYNSRQYAPNFHIPETIALGDSPKIYGKTGLRPYDNQKSKYSSKGEATKALEDLVLNADSKYILLSYNDEGIISTSAILEILGKRGKVKVYATDYRRFRTERDHSNRHYKRPDNKVIEHLYVVKATR